MTDVHQEFVWRGMLYDETEGLADVLSREQVTAYIGFDPTAASLHVGSLLPIMALARLQRFGHSPIAIVGGGTGLIGDPSGKSLERSLLTPEQVENNLQAMRAQLARFLDFDCAGNPARIVNNADWLVPLRAMDLLRDVGKYFTVNYMIAKDSVKRRLDTADGLSFTEFSYLLLQAYDFLVLHDRYGCRLQLGGSDQWGNITAGCDLIRRVRGVRAHGLVMPLVTTAAGAKFGKTEAGTVWLDPYLTSPFRFYQFWLNVDDRDVGRYLKFFTFMTEQEIGEVERSLATAPETREAQRVLARQVTELVHGRDAVVRVERASSLLFSEEIATLRADDVLEVFADVPSSELAREQLAAGVTIVDVLASSGLAPSKSEATRLVKSGGVYVNNRRVSEARELLRLEDAIEGRLFILRKGQRANTVIKIV